MSSLPAAVLLLDMDGVLVDSTGDVELHWSLWAKRRGLDVSEVLQHAHGTPSRDVVARFVPAAEVEPETRWVENLVMEGGTERPLPGAESCLVQDELPVAVVTSATSEMARVKLARAGLPYPSVLVGADHVQNGKPAPEPYLRAAELMGVAPARCVGVEDSPAGLAALRAAGIPAIGLLTSHRREQLGDVSALVPDLGALRVHPDRIEWA